MVFNASVLAVHARAAASPVLLNSLQFALKPKLAAGVIGATGIASTGAAWVKPQQTIVGPRPLNSVQSKTIANNSAINQDQSA